ncbi:SEC14-like protein 2 [Galendromus occidentalis]|uniref:SEC14-like protein 2 n=1 Tax=Galendromus occidentalis TaxID=34638 RepID=A0AAJ6W049_9ACAR|nr:SEC14-like protein 2 [Galendromus occidentalis]
MSGHVGDLSPEQDKALQELRSRCADVWEDRFDDHFVLRWLRARNFSVDKAEYMLRQHLIYRNKIDMDNITKWYKPPEVLEKYTPGGITGYDHEGCPVWVFCAGDFDMRGMLECLTPRELTNHLIYLLELCNEDMERQSKKLGRRIERRVFVVDFSTFSMKQIVSKVVRRFIGRAVFIYESNYPETLKKAYIVNAPSFFPLCWKILRPLLSDCTASKVEIYGKDGWQSEIFKTMDKDQVPVHFGGTLVGPTGCPRCSEWLPQGGPIPEKYYRQNTTLNGENAKTIKLSKRSSHKIELPVENEGSVINWTFRTNGHDLGFALLRKKNDGSLEGCVPSTRVDCHVLPEEGFYTCNVSGTYIFKFDNSYSWFTDKTVTFDVNVAPPSDELEKTSSVALENQIKIG